MQARRSWLVATPHCPAAGRAGREERQVCAGVAVTHRVVRQVQSREIEINGDGVLPDPQATLALDPTAGEPVADQNDRPDTGADKLARWRMHELRERCPDELKHRHPKRPRETGKRP